MDTQQTGRANNKHRLGLSHMGVCQLASDELVL